MCIGVPMRVSAMAGTSAWCTADDEPVAVDMMLVGEQPPGTWVLVFQGAARHVMSDVEAAQTRAALDALAAAMRGDAGLERYFADLVDREPMLPEHLRKPTA